MKKNNKVITGVIIAAMVVVTGALAFSLNSTNLQGYLQLGGVKPSAPVISKPSIQRSIPSPSSTQIHYDSYDTIVNNEQLVDGMYVYSTDKFTYKFDQNLTDSPTVRKNYMKRSISKNEESFYFLENFFGFKHPGKITIFYFLSQSQISGAGNGTTISNNRTQKITQTDVDNFTFGNAHELSHIFFVPTDAPSQYYDQYSGFNWFMEGLAVFLSDYEQYGSSTSNWGIFCEYNSWAEGYLDANNQKVYNSNIVPYYDFSVRFPDDSNGIYSQQSRLGGYRSGECFWKYLYENYGENKFKSIFPVMHQKVSQDPKYYFLIVKEIINPTLGINLTDFIKQRYNYTEPESISSLQ